MLSWLLAHAGQTAPVDVWPAWRVDPLPLISVALPAWIYWRGLGRGPVRHRSSEQWRTWCFVGSMATITVALASPLDALSEVLASAHMVQHLLLVLVAAPLLALSAPAAILLRGTPAALVRAGTRARRALRLRALRIRNPVTAWVLHVATLWFWHAAVPYGAALKSPFVHAVEHTTFLVTAFVFWRSVIGAPRSAFSSRGGGILLVFAMAMQTVLLSALLTFAPTAWYVEYRAAAARLGFDPLADQHLAGLIMWIPAGLVYLAVALALLLAWIGRDEDHGRVVIGSPSSAGRSMPSDISSTVRTDERGGPTIAVSTVRDPPSTADAENDFRWRGAKQ
jgi:putative membrane protein